MAALEELVGLVGLEGLEELEVPSLLVVVRREEVVTVAYNHQAVVIRHGHL